MGTLINVLAVIMGGILGKFLNAGAVKKHEESLMHALGLCTLFIGIGGVISGMLTYTDGVFGTRGTMMIIFSMVPGTLVGELLHIEDHLTNLGERIKKAARATNDTKFVDSFMAKSLRDGYRRQHYVKISEKRQLFYTAV